MSEQKTEPQDQATLVVGIDVAASGNEATAVCCEIRDGKLIVLDIATAHRTRTPHDQA